MNRSTHTQDTLVIQDSRSFQGSQSMTSFCILYTTACGQCLMG